MFLWLLIRFVPEHSHWRQQLRLVGHDIPSDADTMVGLVRLENIEALAVDVMRRGVPGDFLEAGVWRGGAAILMRATQVAAGQDHRRVWLADSFQGLPEPDHAHIADRGSPFHRVSALAVGQDEVRRRFELYGLLDDGVRFIPGWFSEVLPQADVESIALLRVDADMYGSTMDALVHLYDRVSLGGYVIIDDYGAVPECRVAVDEFRASRQITSPLIPVDFTGVYWQVN